MVLEGGAFRKWNPITIYGRFAQIGGRDVASKRKRARYLDWGRVVDLKTKNAYDHFCQYLATKNKFEKYDGSKYETYYDNKINDYFSNLNELLYDIETFKLVDDLNDDIIAALGSMGDHESYDLGNGITVHKKLAYKPGRH